MASDDLRILQVTPMERTGGAAIIASNLHRAYRSKGLTAWLAAGLKETDEPTVLQIHNDPARRLWARLLINLARRLEQVDRNLGFFRPSQAAAALAEPVRYINTLRGREDFSYPGTYRLLSLPPERPTVVNCHNLHGDYFDLRALPDLCRRVPVVLTMHDMWLLTGHCAHAIDCERWLSGCGECPDLAVYPSLRRDGTAFNWQRKKEIYARSRLRLITPSRWLMDQVESSMLAPAMLEGRIINNGVDLSMFNPGDSAAARAKLGLPGDARILLFVGQGGQRNRFKDFATIQKALGLLSAGERRYQLILLCLGGRESGDREERVGDAMIRYMGHTPDVKVVAAAYQAADVYLHAAHADTFPNVVLEALACGTPVVATAVGGIPEQIEDGRTGFLVGQGNAGAMAERAGRLLADAELSRRLGAAAAEHVSSRFSLDRQADSYLDFFGEIIEKEGGPGSSSRWEMRQL